MDTWKKRPGCNTLEEYFLQNMKIQTTRTASEWVAKHINGSYRIDKLKEVADFVLARKGKHITIVGDYDADGVTSTSILLLAFRWLGFKDVSYVIPRRFTQGFGINQEIVDSVPAGSLIITCDNGIAQKTVIQAARNKGIEVVILDHHECPSVTDENGREILDLPNANYIIDPAAIKGTSDFDGYCGAGLCYRFARQMFGTGADDPRRHILMTLAAIGTIGDVMDIREENYAIVRAGISCINRDCTTLGVQRLVHACGIDNTLDAHGVGFQIAPCINAASRMHDNGAMTAVKLLTEEMDFAQADQLAEYLVEQNKQRKNQQAYGLKLATEQALIQIEAKTVPPLVVYVPGLGEGIIGPIAGQLMEKYNMPVFMFTDSLEGDEVIKASGRAQEGYNMIKSLTDNGIPGMTDRIGGHEGAAGLSLRKDQLNEFRARMHKGYNSTETSETGDKVKEYDLEITKEQIPEILENLPKYGPYGKGNPSPVFRITGFIVTPNAYGDICRCMGKDGSTIKIIGNDVEALGLGKAGILEKTGPLSAGMNLTVYGTLGINYFKGRATRQITFEDIEVVQE